MLIVTGTVQARPEDAPEVFRLALEHVRRSRTEPGCLSHDVYVSGEDEYRFFFFERWADQAALDAHFAVPASRGFARRLGELSAQPPQMHIYAAATLREPPAAG